MRRVLPWLLLVVACDQGKKPSPPAPKDAAVRIVRPEVECPERERQRPEIDAGSTEVLATLVRRPCYGRCPVYQVSVYRDGTIEYVGYSHVAVCDVSTRLDMAQVAALRLMFERNRFFSFKAEYLDADMTDASGAKLAYQPIPGMVKTVDHDHGDMKAPSALLEIEDEFDRIVGTERWMPTDVE